MEINFEFAEDITKGKEVGDEEEGPQNRTLRHTRGDRGGLGFKRLHLNKLRTAREIRMEPVKGCVTYAN